MKKIWFTSFVILIGSMASYSGVTAQDTRKLSANIEFQAYPTGLIPGIRIEKFAGLKSAWHLRLGYNWIRHRDLGVHSDERGDGLGFTIGYKRFWAAGHKGWHLGIRTDFWWNSIEWRDDLVSGNSINGMTEITVMQPTVELGYVFYLNDRILLTPALGFGWEWNIRTSGQATGEGAILLIGIQLGRLF